MRNDFKVYKVIAFTFLVTFVALAYVNQQALIYQMGLRIKENNQIHSNLVDRNRIMVYNVLNLKSPANLETKLLAKKVELGIPGKWQVVKLAGSPVKPEHEYVAKKGLFASLFVMGREAEASPNVNSLD
ncbi:MAG: hypothetical protein KKH08_04225 [Candidatus Omnitrophica bacterium]|nr:hypothetical protein [Candidatus Omnitrophota bacterium]